MHVIPLLALVRPEYIDLKSAIDNKHFITIEDAGGQTAYNFDGLLKTGHHDNGRVDCYVQLFRNGVIESVTACTSATDNSFIPGTIIEENLIRAVENYIKLLLANDFDYPFAVQISMLNCFDIRLAVNNRRSHIITKGFMKHDMLKFPEILVENEVEVGKLLHPVFDVLCQSAGYPKSYNYDDNGNWISK